ncbi:MAG: CBS domain-containing protein [Rhodospirillaceae bacterium]|nr:CBS domain-containing protein [Rhodospirillaceae bacterium]MBT5666833.1 CBS domain-containing protein [Rhodospirillaceae bacterium]MBT5810570.1 CBS domain-containing protein [Rhodospirillaceae bacterium]
MSTNRPPIDPEATSRTAIFTKRVRDHARAAPVTATLSDSCGAVVASMTKHGASAALILTAEGRIAGILTEQDIVRRLAFQGAPETPARKIMTAPVMTISGDDYLYHAIARMRRHGLRHMPVIDGEGRAEGMLNLADALGAATAGTLIQIDRLSQDESLAGLRAVKAAQVALADDLFADNVAAPDIQAVLTHVNNDIYRRIATRRIDEMSSESWGPPPVDFCVIVMGSGGRGESFLYPDQDNGFILDDYPDSEHTKIDGYFIELAMRMTQDLDAVGIPLCKGHVMATNPLWRKTISQWRDQISLWRRRRTVVALRLSDIFLDFRAVSGAVDLAAALRTHVTDQMRQSPVFLRDMQADDAEHGVALGWPGRVLGGLFGRFVTEKDDPAHRGAINLKHTGTLPLVEAVRLLALREGVPETSTRARLVALRQRNLIDADETDYLISAFDHVTTLLLRRQIADFKAGDPVGNYVHPDTLTARERDQLVESFKAIRRLRERVASDFTGAVF